jgi:hypothetical protein
VLDRHLALELPALVETGNGRGDEQLLGVGVNMGVQVHVCGCDAGSNIGAANNADAAIDVELPSLAGAVEIQISDALRGIGKASDRIEETHVQCARDFGLPTKARKVCKLPGDFQGAILASAAVHGEAQAAQKSGVALQVDGGLEAAMHRVDCAPRHASGESKVGGSSLDPVASRSSTHGRQIAQAQRKIVGGEVKGSGPGLKIEGGSAVVVVQDALLDRDATGLEIEQPYKRRPGGEARPARMRLIGGSIAVDDEMKLRMSDFQIAQAKVRTEEA